MGTGKRVLIFCCTPALVLANILREHFDSRGFAADLWTGFDWGHEVFPVHDIVNKLCSYDGAVLIASADSASGKNCSPNILIEIGLSYSILGIEKTKVVLAGECELPTNLSNFHAPVFNDLRKANEEELQKLRVRLPGINMVKGKEFFSAETFRPELLEKFIKSLSSSELSAKTSARYELLRWKQDRQISGDGGNLSPMELKDFLKRLSPIIDTKKSESRNIFDVLDDLCLYVDQFDNLIPASKLPSSQRYEKLSEVWIFAKVPLEFSNSEYSAQIWDNVLSNVKNGVKYRYYLGKEAERTFTDRFKNQRRKLAPESISNFSIFVLPDHYFMASITLHFARATSNIIAFLSRQNSERDDVLVQIEANSALEMHAALKNIGHFEDVESMPRHVYVGGRR